MTLILLDPTFGLLLYVFFLVYSIQFIFFSFFSFRSLLSSWFFTSVLFCTLDQNILKEPCYLAIDVRLDNDVGIVWSTLPDFILFKITFPIFKVFWKYFFHFFTISSSSPRTRKMSLFWQPVFRFLRPA